MSKKVILLVMAILTAVPSWCDMDLTEPEEGTNEYIDTVTKVVYQYDPETLKAEVKRGDVIEPDCDCETIFAAGSPDVKGHIDILDKFTVDGQEYKVTKIGFYAFISLKKLTSVSIPSSVLQICGNAFWGCSSLESVEIAEGLRIIDGYAFAGCSSLASITLPQSLVTIGDHAFAQNTSLNTVTSLIEEPFEVDDICDFDNSRIKLFVPKGCKEKYAATNGWNRFYEIEEIEVTGISDVSDASRLNDKGQMKNDKRGNGDCKSPITYNLNGQRLTQKPEKGVYIENGRKRVVK